MVALVRSRAPASGSTTPSSSSAGATPARHSTRHLTLRSGPKLRSYAEWDDDEDGEEEGSEVVTATTTPDMPVDGDSDIEYADLPSAGKGKGKARAVSSRTSSSSRPASAKAKGKARAISPSPSLSDEEWLTDEDDAFEPSGDDKEEEESDAEYNPIARPTKFRRLRRGRIPTAHRDDDDGDGGREEEAELTDIAGPVDDDDDDGNEEDAESVVDEDEEEGQAGARVSLSTAQPGGGRAITADGEEIYETAIQRRLRLRREAREARRGRGRGSSRLTPYDRTRIAIVTHHPELDNVWGDLQTAQNPIKPEMAPQPDGLKLKLLPFQREGLFWMRKQEEGPWKGGALADQMGMGKTIQMISLFLSDRQKPNLVIAPTVAIMQWRNEIESYTDCFKVELWHGQSRVQDIKKLKQNDVVLTSYAVLESCFRKQQSGFRRKGEIIKERSALHAIEWHRVVLDEAHNIKERATNTAKGAFALKSKYKWCLSGTPLQNRVGELYSLIRFMGGDPFSHYFCKKCDCKSLHWSFSDKRHCDGCGHTPMHHVCWWNHEILKPIQNYGLSGQGATAMKKLKVLLDRMMLRRTKIERADDLGLPPRIMKIRRDVFNEEEEDLYQSLYTDSQRKFSTYLDQGTLLNNYSNVFTLLTRMRQMANHPDLVLKSKTGIAAKLEGDHSIQHNVCRICTDVAEDAIQSRCRHLFCRECIKQYLNTAVDQHPECPVCHVIISIDVTQPAIENEDTAVVERQGILGRLDMDKWRSSTKIEALVEELTKLRREDSTIKSLVFSQFVNFLDLIAFRLQRAGFQIARLEGTMTPQARNATIEHFMKNPQITVFLVSLKAGGVALNLTEASRVYIMDPWWNPSVEAQAADRIHRLGQHRPITITRLIIANSIEERIVELQKKKEAMIEAAIGKDDNAMGRLSVNDLRFLFVM